MRKVLTMSTKYPNLGLQTTRMTETITHHKLVGRYPLQDPPLQTHINRYQALLRSMTQSQHPINHHSFTICFPSLPIINHHKPLLRTSTNHHKPFPTLLKHHQSSLTMIKQIQNLTPTNNSKPFLSNNQSEPGHFRWLFTQLMIIIKQI